MLTVITVDLGLSLSAETIFRRHTHYSSGLNAQSAIKYHAFSLVERLKDSGQKRIDFMKEKKKQKLATAAWNQSFCAALTGILANPSLDMSIDQVIRDAREYADCGEDAIVKNALFMEEMRTEMEQTKISVSDEIKEFLHHLPSCPMNSSRSASDTRPCTCGLAKLLVDMAVLEAD